MFPIVLSSLDVVGTKNSLISELTPGALDAASAIAEAISGTSLFSCLFIKSLVSISTNAVLSNDII